MVFGAEVNEGRLLVGWLAGWLAVCLADSILCGSFSRDVGQRWPKVGRPTNWPTSQLAQQPAIYGYRGADETDLVVLDICGDANVYLLCCFGEGSRTCTEDMSTDVVATTCRALASPSCVSSVPVQNMA